MFTTVNEILRAKEALARGREDAQKQMQGSIANAGRVFNEFPPLIDEKSFVELQESLLAIVKELDTEAKKNKMSIEEYLEVAKKDENSKAHQLAKQLNNRIAQAGCKSLIDIDTGALKKNIVDMLGIPAEKLNSQQVLSAYMANIHTQLLAGIDPKSKHIEYIDFARSLAQYAYSGIHGSKKAETFCATQITQYLEANQFYAKQKQKEEEILRELKDKSPEEIREIIVNKLNRFNRNDKEFAFKNQLEIWKNVQLKINDEKINAIIQAEIAKRQAIIEQEILVHQKELKAGAELKASGESKETKAESKTDHSTQKITTKLNTEKRKLAKQKTSQKPMPLELLASTYNGMAIATKKLDAKVQDQNLGDRIFNGFPPIIKEDEFKKLLDLQEKMMGALKKSFNPPDLQTYEEMNFDDPSGEKRKKLPATKIAQQILDKITQIGCLVIIDPIQLRVKDQISALAEKPKEALNPIQMLSSYTKEILRSMSKSDEHMVGNEMDLHSLANKFLQDTLHARKLGENLHVKYFSDKVQQFHLNSKKNLNFDEFYSLKKEALVKVIELDGRKDTSTKDRQSTDQKKELLISVIKEIELYEMGKITLAHLKSQLDRIELSLRDAARTGYAPGKHGTRKLIDKIITHLSKSTMDMPAKLFPERMLMLLEKKNDAVITSELNSYLAILDKECVSNDLKQAAIDQSFLKEIKFAPSDTPIEKRIKLWERIANYAEKANKKDAANFINEALKQFKQAELKVSPQLTAAADQKSEHKAAPTTPTTEPVTPTLTANAQTPMTPSSSTEVIESPSTNSSEDDRPSRSRSPN